MDGDVENSNLRAVEEPVSAEKNLLSESKILVVDDNKALRDITKIFMGRQGVPEESITVASSAEEAEDLLKSGEVYSGIYMDNSMGGKFGKDALIEFRKKYHRMFLALATTDGFSEEERDQLLKDGIDLFIDKSEGAGIPGVKNFLTAVNKFMNEQATLNQSQPNDI